MCTDQDDRLEFFHQGTMVHSESDTVFMMGVPELSFWNLPDNEAESLTALLSVPSVHMPSRKVLLSGSLSAYLFVVLVKTPISSIPF